MVARAPGTLMLSQSKVDCGGAASEDPRKAGRAGCHALLNTLTAKALDRSSDAGKDLPFKSSHQPDSQIFERTRHGEYTAHAAKD